MKTASLVVAAGLLVQSVVFAASLPQERPSKDVTMPTVVHEVKPDYPESAKKERVQGNVMLGVVVKKDGTVGEVTVKKPLHPELDEAAIKAMKQWEFRPGTKDGKAVDVAVDVEMTFNLK
jgi:TonB family protein